MNLSQNKKIAISAVSLFLVSFSGVVLFLQNSEKGLDEVKTDVTHAGAETDTKETNVSEEKAPQKETAESKYRKILNSTKDLIVVIDGGGTIKFASEDFCKMMKVRCGKFVGNLFFNYINSKDLPAFVSVHGKILQNKEEINGSGPYRMIKGLNEMIFMFDAKPIIEKGRVVEIAFDIKDITDKVKKLNDDIKSGSLIENIYPKANDTNESELKMMVNKTS
ncbi:PAS domain S-box protein [Candidatus Peregrinibacteria bacterium]|nr:PAS domain S-box protein [Candidatus Peregrinibacteria bacterium]